MSATVRLADVYRSKDPEKTLYALLKERDRTVNISHRRLPAYREHLRFVRSRPYKAWYLITNGTGGRLGGVYLSKMNEIGIFLFKKHRRKAYVEAAVKLLMKKHAGVGFFLANINPANAASIRFFKRFGFKHIQNTYELRKGGGQK